MDNFHDKIVSTISYTVIERVIESFQQKYNRSSHQSFCTRIDSSQQTTLFNLKVF